MAIAFVLILLAAGSALVTAGMQARRQPQSRYHTIKMVWLFAVGIAFLLMGALTAILLLAGGTAP